MALYALGLALAALVFNAYARLSEVRVGCPDWPGCYGMPLEQVTAQEYDSGFDAQRHRQLEKKHARDETLQRFLAGGVSLLLIRLVTLGWQLKRRRRGQQIWIPVLALLFTFGVAGAGLFTFEHRYTPLALMMQFLGNMVTVALLAWIALRENRLFRAVVPTPFSRSLRWRIPFAIALVAMQIVLGGWSMVNRAGLICPDFPQCNGQWLPPMDFLEAFTAWRDRGFDYEARLLAVPAQTAIHVAHRLGSLLVLLYVGWLALRVLRLGHEGNLCRYGMLVLLALLIETGIGVMQVVTHLPLALAVAHSAFAALMLMVLLALYHVVLMPRKL